MGTTLKESSGVKRRISTQDVALVAVMAALANVLGFFAIPGPWNIQFSMTGIPILLVAFTRGPLLGALTGLLGGYVQAVKYGWEGYVVYTAIQGGVAGFFAKKVRLLRVLAPPFFFFGGFFLTWWVDQMRYGKVTFEDLVSMTQRAVAAGPETGLAVPYVSIVSGVVAAAVAALLVLRFPENRRLLLTLAGCMGAIAYVPYDAFALYVVQQYPWIPTWFVLAKDLVQDFVAAGITASILENKRVRRLLGGA
ncbi:ECF transporter S component [Thermofilum pendens]|uniref:ECF transporter S component n=1 Tax=Thermofilum pendens (strain DSM 2475 / Hrk 5) TaxID=368408 RepID=A1S0F9_THEPD|nr:ECF transporter S component [Thermofilum pendens]ABL78939.1 hypothetical protein Tpen_1543 [Thermofilum pendens Hrk 5]